MANNETSLKTKKALSMIANGSKTPYAAAKECGIAFSTIYRAIKRAKENEKASYNEVHSDMDAR